MNPSSLSQDELSQLIGLIYEGPLEPVPWQQSLVAIRERLQDNHVTLIVRSSTPEDLGLYVNAGNVTTEGYMSYATHYYALDPFVGLPADQVVTVHEILGEARWLESPLYKEYLAQHDVFHVMGVDIRTTGGDEFRLRVCRPRSAEGFSAADKAFQPTKASLCKTSCSAKKQRKGKKPASICSSYWLLRITSMT